MNAAVHPNRWAHRMAVATAAVTFLMIVVGGLVTTMEAGDSEPTWNPMRFWEWFGQDKLPGNLFYEIWHRRIGMLVGLLTVATGALLWRGSSRRLRGLCIAALIGVLAQAGLGGLRVRMVSDPNVQDFFFRLTGSQPGVKDAQLVVRMIHAATAQAFFCVTVTLALLSSRYWARGGNPMQSSSSGSIFKLGRFALVLIFVQLLLGAFVRHARFIQEEQNFVGTLLHIGMAFWVLAVVLILAGKTLKAAEGIQPVRTTTLFLVAAIFVQPFLGFMAWMILPDPLDTVHIGPTAAIVRTGHVATGALIFAACTFLTLMAYRHTDRSKPGGAPILPAGLKQGAQA